MVYYLNLYVNLNLCEILFIHQMIWIGFEALNL